MSKRPSLRRHSKKPIPLKPRHRAATASDPSFDHRGNHFIKRPIRLPGNQAQQPLCVLLQRRDAPPAWLCGGASMLTPTPHPVDHCARARVETLRSFTPRRTGVDSFDRSSPQIIRIWPLHPSSPQEIESMGTRLPRQSALGNPRFYRDGICSSGSAPCTAGAPPTVKLRDVHARDEIDFETEGAIWFRIRPPARATSRAHSHRHGLPLKPGSKVLQIRFCTGL